MQYRDMKLDLHIVIVTLHMYFKFQANTFLPSSVTLTLSWQKGNMGSAHPLVEVNIWAKIEEKLFN